jgi:Uma2 family endonuclease
MTISTEALKPRIRTPRRKTVDVPSYLVYETLEGIPVLYKGWQNVLAKNQKFEEIMAYGYLQALMLTMLKDYLQPLFGKQYWIIQGELGLHVAHKTNPSLDLCIFPKAALYFSEATNNYTTIPPKIVIEVDSKADIDAFEENQKGNYYLLKTQKLLDFGTEQVVWIYTENKKVVIAKPNQPWLTVNWTDEIEIMGHRFTLQSMIDSFEQENEQK